MEYSSLLRNGLMVGVPDPGQVTSSDVGAP